MQFFLLIFTEPGNHTLTHPGTCIKPPPGRCPFAPYHRKPQHNETYWVPQPVAHSYFHPLLNFLWLADDIMAARKGRLREHNQKFTWPLLSLSLWRVRKQIIRIGSSIKVKVIIKFPKNLSWWGSKWSILNTPASGTLLVSSSAKFPLPCWRYQSF